MTKLFRQKYLLIPLFLFLLVFFEPIFCGKSFTFRDESYFYYPLRRYVQSFWESGKLPLWDPLSNLGQPLAAVPPAMAYYPGTLCFFLEPVLGVPYSALFKWFIMGHVLLTFYTMFLFAGRAGLSKTGRTIAGMSYAFGGSILFQYCNIIFLIGAAWLPLVLFFADKLIRGPRRSGFVGMALTLAMMVLGGDPEMAYLSSIPVLLLLFFYWRNGYFQFGLRGERQNPEISPPIVSPVSANKRSFLLTLVLIGTSALLGGMLTAIQVIPGLEVSRLSDRKTEYPMSIWEIPKVIQAEKERIQEGKKLPAALAAKQEVVSNADFYDSPDDIAESPQPHSIEEPMAAKLILDGIFCRHITEPVDHAYNAYRFSIPPWQYAGMVWPNINGTFAPLNTRWVTNFPNEYIWTPSLYMGIIPLVLGLVAIRFFRRRPKTTKGASLHQIIRGWGSWTFLFGVLAGLGLFAPGWFSRLGLSLMGKDICLDLNNGDPVGGLYWLMNVLLPGFSTFRYSAKIFPVAAMAMALLAGLGWDAFRRTDRIRGWIQLIVVGSLCLIGFVWYKGSDLFHLSGIPVGSFFGPYLPEMAWKFVLFGFGQVAVVLFLFYFLLFLRRKIFRKRRAAWLGMIVLFLVGVDLYLANASIVITGPDQLFNRSSAYYEKMKSDHAGNLPRFFQDPPIRTFRESGSPSVFYDTISMNRGSERVLWERHTITPNYHFDFGVGCIHSVGTLTLNDYSSYSERFTNPEKTSGIEKTFPFLGVDYAITTLAFPMDSASSQQLVSPVVKEEETSGEKTSVPKEFIPADFALWKVTGKNEKIKIFHEVAELDNPETDIIEFVAKGNFGNPLEGEYARYTRYEPNRIEMEINLLKDATVLVMEQYYPGWQASIQPAGHSDRTTAVPAVPLKIERGLRFLRKLTLHPGHYQITMEYRPPLFFKGMMISLLSCIVLVIIMTSGNTRTTLIHQVRNGARNATGIRE